MTFGLTKKDIEVIREVIQNFPEVERAVIFGSRAMGNHKRGSDVDLAIMGKHGSKVVSKISGILNEETFLPYNFDIVYYGTLGSQELKEHIDLEGKILYQRDKP